MAENDAVGHKQQKEGMRPPVLPPAVFGARNQHQADRQQQVADDGGKGVGVDAGVSGIDRQQQRQRQRQHGNGAPGAHEGRPVLMAKKKDQAGQQNRRPMADALQTEGEKQANAVQHQQRGEAEQHWPGPGQSAPAQQGQAHQQRHRRKGCVRNAAGKVNAHQVCEQQQRQQRKAVAWKRHALRQPPQSKCAAPQQAPNGR